jgi:predicted nucleic acid-binding protein
MTDFTLHSIGVILSRLNQGQVFLQFVRDVLVDGAVHLLSVPPDQMAELIRAAEKYNLDFDDAYQTVAALRNELILISLDSDFDRTERGRRTPGEIVQELDAVDSVDREE